MISFAFLIIGFFRIMLSFELKKPAQARERVEGKIKKYQPKSSPHEACQKESHL